jgi:hypothetical protein
MPRILRTHARIVVLLAAVYVLPGQITAPPMGASRDLETWARDVGDVPDIEHGVGLHLNGEYTLLVTFAGVKLRRDPRAPSKEIVVMAKPAAALDPGRLLTPGLAFMAVGKDKKPFSVDLSGRVASYPPGPFMTTPTSVSLRATMTPAEFLKLADAQNVRASMLGVDVTLRQDQVKALRALADKLGLVAAR